MQPSDADQRGEGWDVSGAGGGRSTGGRCEEPRCKTSPLAASAVGRQLELVEPLADGRAELCRLPEGRRQAVYGGHTLEAHARTYTHTHTRTKDTKELLCAADGSIIKGFA